MQDVVMFGAAWWTEPLGSWMAWTRATAAFFLFVVTAISAMGARVGIVTLNPSRASGAPALV